MAYNYSRSYGFISIRHAMLAAITVFFEPIFALAVECWRIATLAPLRAGREGWGGLKRAPFEPERHEAHRRSLAAARGV